MAFTHHFDPTTLREYDIRGTVGRTLSEADAFAIGRCFGSIVVAPGRRAPSRSAMTAGCPARQLEAALVKGLGASGIEVVADRPRSDADAVLRRRRS